MLNVLKAGSTFHTVPKGHILGCISSSEADSELFLLFLAYSITVFSISRIFQKGLMAHTESCCDPTSHLHYTFDGVTCHSRYSGSGGGDT